MNTSTEHILQCNQSEPLADASGRRVDLMNENGVFHAAFEISHTIIVSPFQRINTLKSHEWKNT